MYICAQLAHKYLLWISACACGTCISKCMHCIVYYRAYIKQRMYDCVGKHAQI